MIKKAIKYVLKKTLPFIWPLFSKKCTIDVNAAQSNLDAYSAKPTGTPFARNMVTTPICDLQIVIPAYNVEQYLEECLDSILSQQTQYTYKIVLIDDGSTDQTPAIADKYSCYDNVIVIHQSNRGFSGARNKGLQNLFAKYIMFVDSDDKLCPDAIESLLQPAFKYDCDIVEGGALYLIGDELSHCFSHPSSMAPKSPLGIFHGYPWAKVYKAACFEEIVFPEGFWFEDTIISFLLYRGKKSYYCVDQYVYEYRQNLNSITYTFASKPKSLDSYWITEKLMESCSRLQYPFDDSFFNTFLQQVIMNQKRILKLPEIVQQSVFVLSAHLMTQYFDHKVIKNFKHLPLVRALTKRDWGLFRICCKL